MARTGISQFDVEKAYKSLTSQGVNNPSIDAIRAELGNTGSKTTISKYLKDIKKTRTNGTLTEVKVSDAIGHLVSQLAARLNAEANKTIEDMEQAFDKERKSWNQEKSGLEESLSQATEQNKALSDNIHSLQAKLNTASRESEQLNTELQGIQSDLKELTAVCGQKDERIIDLEKSLQHSYDNLSHFRESAKEQRDQQERKHAEEVSGLRAEQRKLGQTIASQQSELTQLNRQNAELITEKRLLAKSQRELQNSLKASTEQVQSASTDREELLAQLDAITKENNELNTSVVQLEHEVEELKSPEKLAKKQEVAKSKS